MSAAGSNNSIPLRLGSRYVEGLALSVASTTTLGIAVGRCRDSGNLNDMSLGSAATINAANAGVLNGIDTGSLGASKLYYVYLIGSSLDPSGLHFPVGGLVSLSSSPLLPSGYDIYRRIGWAFTDGSSHFLTNYQTGDGLVRKYFWDTSIAVLTSGTASTLTAIDLSSAVPPIDNVLVTLEVAFTPATANDKVSFAPYGSTATVLPSISGVVAAKIQTGQLDVVAKLNSSLPKVLYINSAASGNTDVQVYGFADVL